MKYKNIEEINPYACSKKTVYIAGKVTGLTFDEVQKNFNTVEADLLAKGYQVINPIKLVHFDADWQQAMRICVSQLPFADYIYLLNNYLDSKGAINEFRIATMLGIKCFNNLYGGVNEVNTCVICDKKFKHVSVAGCCSESCFNSKAGFKR